MLNKNRNRLRAVFSIVLILVTAKQVFGAGTPLDKKDATLPQMKLPDQFALVFSFGYVTDFMPKDEKTFETVLQNMKRTGINTIHCKYYEWRQKLCEKHGVKMMIDLAVPEHDLKQAPLCRPDEVQATADLSKAEQRFVELKAQLDKINAEIGQVNAQAAGAQDKKALADKLAELQGRKQTLEKEKSLQIGANIKAICEKVKGSNGVWGYGLWYDNGTNGSFLNHAVEKLRTWDPTHVTFVGSYRHRGLESVTLNPGCYGWYDFHWSRGTLWHHLDMMVLHDICKRRNAVVGRYVAYSGLQQDLYTLNQSIAAGLKMALFFIGGPLSRDTHEWGDDQDLVKIAAELRHIYKELAKIGHPLAYYSTPITKDHANKPCKQGIPRWFKPVPTDHWAQVTSGEAVVGFFRYKDGTDAVFVANHNAFASQKMTLSLKPTAGKRLSVQMFDRAKGGWKPLELNETSVSFHLGAGCGELLKITGVASQ